MATTSDILRERVPLEVVIKDKKLMKTLWDDLSVPQQVIVKALYGLPLSGLGEERAWAILNDQAEFDQLGFPTKWFPKIYEPKEYETLVALIGRRSGKSYLTCFIALYEIVFGGHAQYVEEGADFVVPYVAQDLPTARVNMRTIALLANKVPLLKQQLQRDGVKQDSIRWKNGLTVQIEPPRVKTGRGWAMPLIIMDEVGFWATADEASDPDFEVQRSLSPSQLQFPHRKTLIISSPYTEKGILWDYYKAGTDGFKLNDEDDSKDQYVGTLVLKAPTGAMDNPRTTAFIRASLKKERAKDPEAFEREFNARFAKAINSFIDGDTLRNCTDTGIKERRLEDVAKGYYLSPIAVMDPGFRHDSFAFAIFHRNSEGIVVQDILKVWTPDKKLGIVLNPQQVLKEIHTELLKWDLSLVYSDQYQLEALQQIAQGMGFSVVKNDFTGRSKSKMYGSLNQLLKTQKIRLLDHDIIYQQLTRLQKKLTASNTVQINAPDGEHDDVASVVAMGADLAIRLYPQLKPDTPKGKTLFEEGLECIARKKVAAVSEDAWV